MKSDVLNNHIIVFMDGYTSHVDKLSSSLGSSSCLVDKMSTKAFILRNYIRILKDYRLLEDGMEFVGGITFTDLVIDKSVNPSNIYTITLTHGSIVISIDFSEDITGILIANEFYNRFASYPTVGTLLSDEDLYIYSDNSTTVTITASDLIGVQTYSNIAISSDLAEEYYVSYRNLLSFDEICSIITNTYKILDTQCNCN